MARPINPVLPAFIDNEGRVIWRADSEARWKSITEFLRNQEVEISIGRRRRKRSSRQNRYYWGVIIPMLQEASGYGTPEEMHDALRMYFLRERTDTGLPSLRSTSDLSTTETEEYYAQCRQLGAEMFDGLYIPLPNEVDENLISAPAVEVQRALPPPRRPRLTSGK
jgi:hypothetical protein